MKLVGKIIRMTVWTLAVNVLALTLVWLIPDSKLEHNVREGTNLIKNEESVSWYRVFTYSDACQLDNPSDTLIMFTCFYDGDAEYSALEKAMVPDYARYWHGYMVFLRPLQLFLSYADIRYVYMLLHVILFSFMLVEFSKRKSGFYAMAFAASMGCIYFMILPYNLNFSSVFFIMYTFSIWLLKRYDENYPVEKLVLLFWCVGMVTNFFDLLTAPLITLGVPLIIVNVLNPEGEEFKSKVLRCIYLPISWGGGYGISWIAKWILGSIILRINVLEDAVSQAQYRVNGNEEEVVNRVGCIMKNLLYLIPEWSKGNGMKALYLLITVGYLFCFVKCHKEWKVMRQYLVFLLIATFPYIWFGVFANHSAIHTFFTYRIQLITLFSMLVFFYSLIDWLKLKRLIRIGKGRE